MLARDMRMMDGQVIAALQNGTAFFASTSLIAIGGALTLLRSSEEMLTGHRRNAVRCADLAHRMGDEGDGSRRHLHLRLLQVRVVVPALQLRRDHGRRGAAVGRKRHRRRQRHFAHRTAVVITEAGRHFNRGQRAFFFALGYLGWFIGPVPLMVTTAGVVVVMWRRQFTSASRDALIGP